MLRIENDVRILINLIANDIKARLATQGHVNTGALRDSLEVRITSTSERIVGELLANDYWQTVDTGVPASRIPYSGRSGGGTSKYIQGLIRYFQRKGVVDPRAAAFATANVHRREGMPTKASARFSSNGKRTGAFSDVIEENEGRIEQLIESAVSNVLLGQVNRL